MKLTIKDIARLAEVSPTAVSFVLNEKADGNVSAEKQRIIRKIVRQHNFKQDRNAKALVMQRLLRVAVCYMDELDATSWFGKASHHLLINSIAACIHQTSYSIDLIEVSAQQPLKELGAKLIAHNVDGFLFANFDGPTLEKIGFLLIQNGLPVVSAGTSAANSDIDWVAVDREKSFEHLVSHALAKTAGPLGFIDTDSIKVHSPMKQQVFERVLKKAGRNAEAVCIIDRFSVKSIADNLRQMIVRFPDLKGIILTDNALAPYVQMLLAGRAIELFGFGDYIFVPMCDPPIAYMRLPMDKVAKRAVEHLLFKIEHPRDAVRLRALLACDLVTPC